LPEVGKFTAGPPGTADAVLASDNDNPAAPNTGRALLRRFCFEACFEFDMTNVLPSVRAYSKTRPEGSVLQPHVAVWVPKIKSACVCGPPNCPVAHCASGTTPRLIGLSLCSKKWISGDQLSMGHHPKVTPRVSSQVDGKVTVRFRTSSTQSHLPSEVSALRG
jgi:hypothetical protein